MNKPQFISKLLCASWNIDKIRGRTVLSSILHPLLRSASPASDRPAEDIFGDPLPKMQLAGDIAIIPLTGIISIDVPDWIKQFGINLTDANDIAQEIDEAIEDANVQIIVFDVNSPGGLSTAGDKLFDLVDAANKKKPCFAYCGDGRDMASTAYEAVAACTALLCGRYADGVGCIGSYLAYLDDTDFWAMMGIKWEIFKSGELKGIGEGVPLTEAQRTFLQESTDYFGNNIRRNVMKYRSGIAPEDLQGQWFDGRTAAKKNFVAGFADDLQSAIAKFRRMTKVAA